jgi:deoxyinosine 3'endonuclease (endonuclease V)
VEKKPHSWAFHLQKEISTKIITYDIFDKLENICGIDVSYKSNVAYCSAVITKTTFDLIASVNRKYQYNIPILQVCFS